MSRIADAHNREVLEALQVELMENAIGALVGAGLALAAAGVKHHDPELVEGAGKINAIVELLRSVQR